jgi:hypothetical protein
MRFVGPRHRQTDPVRRRLDGMENTTVLSSRTVRLARLGAAAVAAFLVPWCAVLGATLPSTAKAQHWACAWVGLDLGIAFAAATTAVLLARDNADAALAAMSTGTLMLADAWFDICTSAPGLDHEFAVLEASFVEIPLALAALWLAVRLSRPHRNSSSRDATASNTACSPGWGA